jgi:hypothetical protein
MITLMFWLFPIRGIKFDVCVVLSGLSRSAKITSKSLDEHVLRPIRESNKTYAVYLHAWFKSDGVYYNELNKEAPMQLDKQDALWIPANVRKLEPEPQVAVEPYLKHGDPWKSFGSNNNTALHNCLLGLLSMKRATRLWGVNDCYTVVHTRPDLTYLSPLKVSWLDYARLHHTTILLPNHAQWPVNDRFAIGRASLMKRYGNRFDWAQTFAEIRSLHSEEFLQYVINRLNWTVKTIDLTFRRTRTSGYLVPELPNGHADM